MIISSLMLLCIIGDTQIYVGDVMISKGDPNKESKTESIEYVVVAITRRSGVTNTQPLIWHHSLELRSLTSTNGLKHLSFTQHKSQFQAVEKRILTSLWNEYSPRWLKEVARREQTSWRGKTNRIASKHPSPPQPKSIKDATTDGTYYLHDHRFTTTPHHPLIHSFMCIVLNV